MKLTRDRVIEMMSWCESNSVKYARKDDHGSATKQGTKNNQRTPNGVLYHYPRVMSGYLAHTNAARMRLKRAFVLWNGETLDAIEEACAFIIMTTNRTDLFLIRLAHASKTAWEIENASK